MPVSKQRCTEVIKYLEENGQEATERFFRLPSETITRYQRAYNAYGVESDEPIDDENALVTLEAQKQKASDLNGILRKANRESYRLYNSLEAVYDEYVTLLKSSPFADFTVKKHTVSHQGRIGVVHFSDIHFNEIIAPEESNGNVYDFTVASKRLKKYVSESIELLHMYKAEQVYIMLTGDIINSNRRLSEKMASATSQTRASLLATYLLQQVIIEFAQEFSVSVASVSGNEARAYDDNFDSSDVLSSENWDYLIYNNLRMLFDGKPVEFIDGASNITQVVTLDSGFNVMLTHGNFMKGAISDKQIGTMLQGYLYRGVPIHMVLIGHLHSASVGDTVCRSSSLCGGNSYSTNDLYYISRASQNLYIVNPDMGFHGIKIDLQNTDGIEGYNIIKELEMYHVRGVLPNTRVTIDSLI